jgi:hypothetical protein
MRMSHALLPALLCAGAMLGGCKARSGGQVKETDGEEGVPPEAAPETTQIPDMPGEAQTDQTEAGVAGELGCVCEGNGASYYLNRYVAQGSGVSKSTLEQGLTLASCVKAKFKQNNCGTPF